jgi:lipopolysaccharide transport system ATP-binding protein
MSSEPAIRVQALGKCYQIYAAPRDRLKQLVTPPLVRNVAPLAGVFGLKLAAPQYYREFWALRDVSFDVARGETLGIIGVNGSGKSTLLQMICGTLTPTTGTAEVKGRVAALLELGSGFNPEFSGRENVYLNASVLGLTGKEIDHRLDDILAFADIGEFIDQPVRTYSSGMAIRLAFAVVAHVDAEVLIIDEVLAVGDAYFQQKCMRWLRNFRERGTVLFCGHDTGAVTNLCNRAVWLDHGRARGLGPAKEVSEAYLATIYARSTGLSDADVRPAKQSAERRAPAPVKRKTGLSQIIEVMEFNDSSASFGTGDATILDVRMTRSNGREPGLIEGGEDVQVAIRIAINADLESPIVGFHVKDRLGQALFGDNTYLQYRDANLRAKKGQVVEAAFAFEMPFLQTGDYSVTAAVASGTMDNHVQHHWMHDSIFFKVHSPFRNGVLIAIPMNSIAFEIKEPATTEES